MHTARQLNSSLFSYEVDSQPATLDTVLPDWGPLDRFGIIVHEPFGTIGASYLVQSAIVAYYDIRPSRRDFATPSYPEIYVFHVGGRYGSHAYFDFFPPRKEVFVENDPVAILTAINDRGITRLAVPDRTDIEPVQHEWKEPSQAIDRIQSAFAYSATGRTRDADVWISASKRSAEANGVMTLFPNNSPTEAQEAVAALAGMNMDTGERWQDMSLDREIEVDEATRVALRERRATLKTEKGWAESYRRIPAAQSLQMLHIGPAPAFVEVPKFGDE
ncbi:MAG TPA: hypothetical protein VNT53_00500 [Pseudolysinimonas sp.]|nr:hypothetical protein [Pseudolysinimonas sp.]